MNLLGLIYIYLLFSFFTLERLNKVLIDKHIYQKTVNFSQDVFSTTFSIVGDFEGMYLWCL